ncbi:MAG: 50S ribosome-binding GTPase, partial [Actinobacteria bacterium]|nr:50S ribosome-binding GTPase [Actinomycetota bacterium]
MAVEIGIVGLQSSGKSTLFAALTGARGEVGMAAIPDPRLQQLADVVHARKVTPAAIRVVEVRGTGPELLGKLRQVDALLVVLDDFSGTRVPDDDLETLKLELLVADRDHVERRLERVAKQAKSGDTKLKREAADLERLLAHLDSGQTLAEWNEELPPELEPLTTKPLLAVVNGPGGGIDLQLEAELAEMSPEDAAEFRGAGESALGSIVRRLVETLD